MGSVDCGDKKCYLTYKIVESCVVYLPTNNSHCEIPCILDECQTKILNGVRCAIWTCEFYPTPTPIITTTTSSPPLPPTESVGWQVFSAICGCLALCALLFFLLRKNQNRLQGLANCIRQFCRLRRNNSPRSSPLPFDDQNDAALENDDEEADHQPQRDFFSVALDDEADGETESDGADGIRFLNVTPPGAASSWHFHSVAGSFTEAAKQTFSNATEKAKNPRESLKKLLRKSNYERVD